MCKATLSVDRFGPALLLPIAARQSQFLYMVLVEPVARQNLRNKLIDKTERSSLVEPGRTERTAACELPSKYLHTYKSLARAAFPIRLFSCKRFE